MPTGRTGVSGTEGAAPLPCLLDDPHAALPMAASLQNRKPEIGRAGIALCRQYPHLVCENLLAHLGGKQTWQAGRLRFDAAKVLGLVFERIASRFPTPHVLALAVPIYVSPTQVEILPAIGKRARLPIAGAVPIPLAVALAARSEHALAGPVIVIDADDQALSWTLVNVAANRIEVAGGEVLSRLGVRIWKSRLLDAIALSCIRHSRRDPRNSGAAEQMLYDQLDDALDLARQDQMVEVVVKTSQWSQNLIIQPHQILSFCNPLIQETAEAVRAAFASASDGPPRAVLVTTAAAALPGLVSLLETDSPEVVPIIELPADCAARGAFHMAAAMRGATCPGGRISCRFHCRPKGRRRRWPRRPARDPHFLRRSLIGGYPHANSPPDSVNLQPFYGGRSLLRLGLRHSLVVAQFA